MTNEQNDEREQQRAMKRRAVPESLPAIDSGTEKQNAYAVDVRAQAWSLVEAFAAEARTNPGSEDVTTEKVLEAEPRLRRIFAIRDHRFWLDVARVWVYDAFTPLQGLSLLLQYPETQKYLAAQPQEEQPQEER